MSNNIIKSICWDITSRCNEHCGFCYRNPQCKELNLEANKIILKKLIDFGVDKISFVGGEPLLYKDIFELLEWGKSYAQDKTVFSITTNAVLLTEIVDEEIKIDEKLMSRVFELFDWVTFSLDAPNTEIQSLMGRNSLHFDRIVTILNYLNKVNYQNRVKINTVVSKINFEYLTELYDLLCKYNVHRWKIFRFLASRGSALFYKDKYYIAEDVFANKINEIARCNSKIKISVNDYDKFDNSYITISSEGKLVVYDKGQYLNQVDLLKENVGEVLKYINLEEHIRKRSDFLYV